MAKEKFERTKPHCNIGTIGHVDHGKNTSSLFSQGKFVTAYYKADRIFKAQIPQHVEKVTLKKDLSSRR